MFIHNHTIVPFVLHLLRQNKELLCGNASDDGGKRGLRSSKSEIGNPQFAIKKPRAVVIITLGKSEHPGFDGLASS